MLNVKRCRLCGNTVYWVAAEKSGKIAPINTNERPDGNIIVNTLSETYRVLDKEDCEKVRDAYEREGLTPPLHLNHFVTCPHATRWSHHA